MNTPIRILIVEDEILIADYLKGLLEEENYSAIMIAYSAEEAKIQMNDFLPDLILMDINIGSTSRGIELSQYKNSKSKLIYITSQTNYSIMQKAIATSPENYLTIPIKKNDLIAAVKLASLKVKQNFLRIKIGTENIKIPMDEILYIKSDKNYLDIFTQSKRYTNRQSLESILELLDKNRFIKVHKSFIVNKMKINKLNRTTLFIGEVEIPRSRSIEIEL